VRCHVPFKLRVTVEKRTLPPLAQRLLRKPRDGTLDPTMASNTKKKMHRGKGGSKRAHQKGSDHKWSSKVKTVSTYPPKDLCTKDAETIARVMATKKVSPKGLGSAIRMVQFYINRAGKSLSAARKRELEKAKHILQDKAARKKAHA
jgi:tRNA(adenine34) deaminase